MTLIPDDFSDEPNPEDPLQLAGDAALTAIRELLAGHGVGSDDYDVVLSISVGSRAATIMHLAGNPSEEEYVMAAFETQLVHLQATATQLGIDVRAIPVRRG